MEELLTRLYSLASDHEAAVLDDLLMRADYIWACECGWHNGPPNFERCEECGRPRPREEDA